MKRLFLLALLLWGIPAFADCQSAPPVSFPSGVTCVFTGANAATINNQPSSVAVTFSGLASSDSVTLALYFCGNANCVALADWASSHSYTGNSGGIGSGAAAITPTTNNPCNFTYVNAGATGNSGGSVPTFNTNGTPCMSQTGTVSDGAVTWSPLYPVINDNAGTRPDCNFSASSPFTGAGVGNLIPVFPNFHAYCPTLGTSKTSFFFNCSVTNSCSFPSIFVSIFSGMCTAASGCITTDGQSGCNACTSLSGSTSGALTFTNELVIALGETRNDEVITAGGGCTDLMAAVPGDANKSMAKIVSGAGATASCSQTWTGSDFGSIIIMAVKSAASVAASTNQFPRLYQ